MWLGALVLEKTENICAIPEAAVGWSGSRSWSQTWLLFYYQGEDLHQWRLDQMEWIRHWQALPDTKLLQLELKKRMIVRHSFPRLGNDKALLLLLLSFEVCFCVRYMCVGFYIHLAVGSQTGLRLPRLQGKCMWLYCRKKERNWMRSGLLYCEYHLEFCVS